MSRHIDRMGWVLLLTVSTAQAFERDDIESQSSLYSFESAESLSALNPLGSFIQVSKTNATEGLRSLEIKFLKTDYPSLRFEHTKSSLNWDNSQGLAIDAYNPSSQELPVSIRITHDPLSSGSTNAYIAKAVLQPWAKTTLTFFFHNPSSLSQGMTAMPRLPGHELMVNLSKAKVDLSRIVRFEIYLSKPQSERTLYIDRVRTFKKPWKDALYQSIVDSYGQFTKENYPGKVHSDDDLQKNASIERDILDQQLAELTARTDRFGGTRELPPSRPTGYFRTEKIDGKWWFITPEGNRFISVGVDSVGMGRGSTYVQGREWMYESIPGPAFQGIGDNSANSPDGSGRQFAKGVWANFYESNLVRRYGKGYSETWHRQTVDRLRAWGFNTLGYGTEQSVVNTLNSQGHRTPYAVALAVPRRGAEVSTGQDMWRPMRDPYDPTFAEDVNLLMRSSLPGRVNDPYLIGYYVDIELSVAIGKNSAIDRERYALAYGALSLNRASSPAKTEFLARLRTKYGSIANLNRAWSARFRDWTSLDAPFVISTPLNAQMRSDFAGFVLGFMEKYYGTIAATIRRYDPNHLYLGSNFAMHSPESLAACAKFCDVQSFTVYTDGISQLDWAHYRYDRPILISEYHFGATDRGAFHPGLVKAVDQMERGAKYQRYVSEMAANPYMIGAHWYQFLDQPLTGNLWVGENNGIGIVTITDTPHSELIEAARKTNASVYKMHQAATPITVEQTESGTSSE